MSQQQEIARVRGKIKPAVLAFARQRIETGQVYFHMRELHDWVFQQTQIAPASPDRILRDLRQSGHFDYEVINRAQSEYRFIQGAPCSA